MAIKPILFNTEMVRAILDGRKSCTRRVIKFPVNRYTNNVPLADKVVVQELRCDKVNFLEEPFFSYGMNLPYQPEDVLYVRETWSEWTGGYVYKAWNSPFPQAGAYLEEKWHPSIHMPKDAARIWLKVTEVRVERLQDIDGKGCVKEGIEEEPLKDIGDEFVKGMFHDLWDSTIKKSDLDRYGWNANPWVWVIEFEWCKKPKGEN